jgi:transposase-like protein
VSSEDLLQRFGSRQHGKEPFDCFQRVSMFKGRRFDQSVILLCIRWYLAYSLSLRDLEEMMAERGIADDHATIHRRTIRYAPLLLERFNRRKRGVTGKWHRDETDIKFEASGCISNAPCRQASPSGCIASAVKRHNYKVAGAFFFLKFKNSFIRVKIGHRLVCYGHVV